MIPKVSGRLVYSPKLGLPASSQFDYKSSRREAHVSTEAKCVRQPDKAGKTAAQAASTRKL